MPVTSKLITSQGDEIVPCWVKDLQDFVVLFNAMLKGYARPCDSRFDDRDRKTAIASGFWCWLCPGSKGSKVSRWTDGRVWSASRLHGTMALIYRQVDQPQPRSSGPRRNRVSPYNRPHLAEPTSTASISSHREHEFLNTVFDRCIVASLNQNSDYTLDGMCKKTMRVRLHGIDYRVVSYYNTLDAHNGTLPRASEVPLYRDLEMDPDMWQNALWVTESKKGPTKTGPLRELLVNETKREMRESSSDANTVDSDGDDGPSCPPPPSPVTASSDSCVPDAPSPSSTSNLTLSSPSVSEYGNQAQWLPAALALPAQIDMSRSVLHPPTPKQEDEGACTIRISRSRSNLREQQEDSYAYDLSRSFLPPAVAAPQQPQHSVYELPAPTMRTHIDFQEQQPVCTPATTWTNPYLVNNGSYPFASPSFGHPYPQLSIATNYGYFLTSDPSPTSYYPTEDDYKHVSIPLDLSSPHYVVDGSGAPMNPFPSSYGLRQT